jgi:hypothetical protein
MMIGPKAYSAVVLDGMTKEEAEAKRYFKEMGWKEEFPDQ